MAARCVDAGETLSYSETMSRCERGFYAGVDAGASRTRCVITDETGRVVGVGSGPAGAYHPTCREASADAIRRTLSEASAPLGAGTRLIGLGLAVAGAGRAGRADLLELLNAAHVAEHVVAITDAEAALWGAFPSGRGIVVIAGTGSVAYGRDGRGAEALAGGWGREIDDVGGAWWMGSQALRAVARAHDGRGPDTILTDFVLRATGCSRPEDLIAWARDPARTPRDFAELALTVEKAAAEGDEVGTGIIEKAATALAQLASSCASRLAKTPESRRVALVGGLAARSPSLRYHFARMLDSLGPGLQLCPPVLPAVFGALLRLWADIGTPADNHDLDVLISQTPNLPPDWGYFY
ncbi:MAG: hypothetical protein N2512_11215 [Armatimonadetes bacterium]|nr:hypothetical protein [Armatimonadota bacterium]